MACSPSILILLLRPPNRLSSTVVVVVVVFVFFSFMAIPSFFLPVIGMEEQIHSVIRDQGSFYFSIIFIFSLSDDDDDL